MTSIDPKLFLWKLCILRTQIIPIKIFRTIIFVKINSSVWYQNHRSLILQNLTIKLIVRIYFLKLFSSNTCMISEKKKCERKKFIKYYFLQTLILLRLSINEKIMQKILPAKISVLKVTTIPLFDVVQIYSRTTGCYRERVRSEYREMGRNFSQHLINGGVRKFFHKQVFYIHFKARIGTVGIW